MLLNESTAAFTLVDANNKSIIVDAVLQLHNTDDLSLEQVITVFKNINICHDILNDPLLLPTAAKIFDTFKTAIDYEILDPLEIPLEYETLKGNKINAAEMLLLVAIKSSSFESNFPYIDRSLKILDSHFNTTPSFAFQAKAQQQQSPEFYRETRTRKKSK